MNINTAVIWLNNFKVCLNNEVYCDDDKKLTLKELHEVIDLLERGEKFEKIVEEIDKEYGAGTYCRTSYNGERYLSVVIKELKQKYFQKPCSKIKQLEQFKAEFVKSEHSYYMERFMETCIKLFKEKEI